MGSVVSYKIVDQLRTFVRSTPNGYPPTWFWRLVTGLPRTLIYLHDDRCEIWSHLLVRNIGDYDLLFFDTDDLVFELGKYNDEIFTSLLELRDVEYDDETLVLRGSIKGSKVDVKLWYSGGDRIHGNYRYDEGPENLLHVHLDEKTARKLKPGY